MDADILNIGRRHRETQILRENGVKRQQNIGKELFVKQKHELRYYIYEQKNIEGQDQRTLDN